MGAENAVKDPAFYAGFIESWGSGTLRIAELAKEANLEIPEFVSRPGEFRIVLRKRILTATTLKKMGLNERQVAAVLYVLEHERLTSREYQDLWSISRATAGRELGELVEKGILLRHGEAGRNIFYTVAPANASVRIRWARTRQQSGEIGWIYGWTIG